MRSRVQLRYNWTETGTETRRRGALEIIKDNVMGGSLLICCVREWLLLFKLTESYAASFSSSLPVHCPLERQLA